MNRYLLGIGGIFLFACVVFLLIPLICLKVDRELGFPREIIAVDIWIGVALLLIGGAIALWCVILFSRVGKGTPIPLFPPREFVAVGPYRYARNPMMIGEWLILLGEAMALHSFSLLLFTIFIFVPIGVLFRG